MKTTTENTFPKASVMRFADKIEYADGGVVSKQVLKNDAGKIGFNEEELDFLDDITVENKQCDNLAGIYAGILTGMSDARVSAVSNNLAGIMKYLAVINIVFMPLTVITGLGGMSEFTMMTEGIWWPHAYSALVLVMVIVGYVTYLLVKQIGTNNSGRRR